MLSLAFCMAMSVVAQPQQMELLLTDFDDGAQPVLVGQQLPPKCSAGLVSDPVHGGKQAAHLHYDYPPTPGIMYSGIALSGVAPHFLAGNPSEFRCFVYGDGSNQSLRLRLSDASGECFQYNLCKLDFKGWRQVSCNIARNDGHWGGNGNGKVDLPLTFDSLLVDSDIEPFVSDVFFDDLSYVTVADPAEALQVTADSGWFGDVVFSDKPWSLKLTVRNMATSRAGGRLLATAFDCRGNEVARAEQNVDLAAGASATLNLRPPGPTAGLLAVKVTVGGVAAGPFRLAVLPAPHDLKPAPDGFFGACTHFGQGKHRVPQTLELLRRAGVEWLRDEIPWSVVERKKGEHTFTEPYYEAFMSAAEKTGVRPLIIADYTNQFYDGGQSPHTEEAWDASARYAVALARHYRSVLRDIEIYNEPNISFWSGRKPDAGEYFGLLKASYTAIKQAFPDDTVVGVCTAGTDLAFIEGVLKLGGAKYMDALSIHPYRYPGSPEATHFTDEVQRCYDLMCRYGMEGKKIWLTEIGWPTHTGPGGVDERTSANYLVRMYTLARSLPFVERVIWYDLQDDGRDPTYNEMRFGLITYDASQAKAGFVAYWVMTHHLAGARFVRKLLPATPDDPRYVFLFRRGDQDIVVAWAAGAEDTAAFSLGGKSAHLQWADAFSEDRPTPGGVLTLKLSDMPVFFAGKFPNLKLARSPLQIDVTPARPAAGDSVQVKATVSPDLADPMRRIVLTPPPGWGEPRRVRVTKRNRTVSERFTVPVTALDGPARFAMTVTDPDESIAAEAARSVVVTPFLLISWFPEGQVAGPVLPAEVALDNPRDTAEKGVRVDALVGPAQNVALSATADLPPNGRLTRSAQLPLPPAETRRAAWPLTIAARARGHLAELKTSYPIQHVGRVDGLKIDGDLSDWDAAQVPFDALGPADWIPLEPGAPKPDLSAQCRVAWSPDGLSLAVAVRDAKHHQAFEPEDMWQGDSLQIAADPGCAAWRNLVLGSEPRWLELGFALGNDGKQMARCWRPDASRLGGVRYAVARTGDATTYEVFVPASSLGAKSLAPGEVVGFALLVNDNDGAGRRGWLQLYQGIGYAKDPRQFGLLILDTPAR